MVKCNNYDTVHKDYTDKLLMQYHVATKRKKCNDIKLSNF